MEDGWIELEKDRDVAECNSVEVLQLVQAMEGLLFTVESVSLVQNARINIRI